MNAKRRDENKQTDKNMKLKDAEESLKSIAELIRPLVPLFEYKSGDVKNNAQQNLMGRTHFVDDDTLRWHKSRVLASHSFANGLLFKLTTSDAKDMRNTERGIRVHVFDVFGSHVWGMDLQDAKPRREQADKAFNEAEFDVSAHYRKAIASKLDWMLRDAANLTKALAQL